MDCIVGMRQIAADSIDMILCDLPYGTTDCRWDSIIPFDVLWEEYNRIIKPNGVIVLTACQPFTTKLIQSNLKSFKYCWYWLKNQVTGYPFAKSQPLRCVEDICVFYKSRPTYNPQGLIKLDKPTKHTRTEAGETVLDNCIGSGTTAVACINTNRHYIGFEIDTRFYETATSRIQQMGK